MILTRTTRSKDGIFGELEDEGNKIATTLEHAYPSGGVYLPKIPEGKFVCVRGDHQLKGMKKLFETFCIQVPNHTNLLFHAGNWNEDSAGCVILGQNIIPSYKGLMITSSEMTFINFMKYCINKDTFELIVKNSYNHLH